MTSPEQFPPPGPGELAPARKRGSKDRNTHPQPATQHDEHQVSQSEQHGPSYQARPPEYQAQPTAYRAQPAEHESQPQSPQYQQQPGYQQTHYQQPQYQQQPGYQYQQTQYQQPQYPQQAAYQQPPGYQHPPYAQQPAYGVTQQRSRRGWMFALAAVVLLVPVGIGTWYLVRGSGGSSERDRTSAGRLLDDPQFQYSFAVGLDEDSPYSIYIPITGTSDDLYVAESGDDSSTVAHYVGGELDWESTVGFSNSGYFSVSGDIMIFTSTDDEYENAEMIRLDPETGSTLWTTAIDDATVQLIDDDRLYVYEYARAGLGSASLAEYDPATGEEINRITGDSFRYTEDAYIQTDSIELTAQLVDLDLNPVGDPIAIEPTGGSAADSLVDRYDNGWVYYADRSTYGGESGIVGVSPVGDVEFECQTQVEQPNQISMRDNSTLVVQSFHDLEVIDVDEATCTSMWIYQGSDQSSVTSYGDFPSVWTYPEDDDDGGPDIELLDWATGSVIATGQTTMVTDGDDRLVTFDGPTVVSRQIGSGDELWAVDATTDSGLRILDGTMIVITPSGGTAVLDVYAD